MQEIALQNRTIAGGLLEVLFWGKFFYPKQRDAVIVKRKEHSKGDDTVKAVGLGDPNPPPFIDNGEMVWRSSQSPFYPDGQLVPSCDRACEELRLCQEFFALDNLS